MDTFKLILFFVFIFQSGFAFSQSVFDMGEHSGIIRDSTGNYSQVSANGSVRSLTSNTALAVIEKPIIQTSKGALEVTLSRAASVDVSRIGSAVSKFAQRVGPLAMALSTAQLICDLSNICNDNGVFKNTDPTALDPVSYPAETELGYYYYLNPATGGGQTYSAACQAAAKYYSYTGTLNGTICELKEGETPINNAIAEFMPSSCSSLYTNTGTSCVKNSTPNGTPATASDWSAKESALNNSGFVPELFNQGLSIPVGTPTLTGSPVTLPLGSTTKTLKDGAGNVTGSEVTTDSLSITDGATSDNPNRINLTQTTITNNYNTSNVLTSSSTTVTDPQQPKTDGIEIEIDNMQDQPLEQQAIPGIFSHTSWGSGSCPGDRSVSYHYGTLNLSFQPACDAAIALQPLVVILAGIAALFIISGAVRND